MFRATLNDYRRSGYDRGHLAAAGNHKYWPMAQKETFSLSNMSPQVRLAGWAA
jgi:endonuclease G